MSPWASADGSPAPFLTALFTAVSAVCVTGLIVVDTPVYWSGFGQGIILVLFQIGGLGIMTGATLLSIMVGRRFQLSRRLIAQAETKTVSLGDVGGVLRLVITVTLLVEAACAVFLGLRLHFSYGEDWRASLWHGLFQAVSAFNNAGFSSYSDSLIGFALDPWILGPLMLGVVIGGLGFPVMYELRQNPRDWAAWSIHTKLTLFGTALLLLVGFVGTAMYEWNNTATLGLFGAEGKALNALVYSVMARTAGFNSIDIGQLRTETLALTYALMLIGGGSAGTAGGIKVTTFFLLGFIVWAEVRGHTDTIAFRRRVSVGAQRQALSVALLAAAVIGIATLLMLSVTSLPLADVLFEVISAFATVGLSTGITADLPPAGQLILIVLMFVGRVGTITIATALALNERTLPYRYPEERPIVG